MATPTKAEILKEAAKCNRFASELEHYTNVSPEIASDMIDYFKKRAADLTKSVSPPTMVKQRLR